MSNLTGDEKLRALGLKAASSQNNPYQSIFDKIRNAKDYSTFSSDVNGLADFSGFESYLTNTIGLSSSEASRFRQAMESKYADFSAFQTALSGFSDYDGWINSLRFGTTLAGDETDGTGLTSGVRIHGEAGLSYDNVSVPKGTVEIFGPRIEFSETGSPVDASTSFSFGSLSVSDTSPFLGQEVTISTTVTNNSGFNTQKTVKLTENGQVVDSKTITLDDLDSQTVEFKRTYNSYTTIDVEIGSAGPTTINVQPATL